MASVEDEIVEAGAQIIWVLEFDHMFQPGTAKTCMDVMDGLGSEDQGWCVGDSQTQPEAGTFDMSPFSLGRGFDIIVPRSSMKIVWNSNHGTPAGNENLDGPGVLDAVIDEVAKLR